MSNVRTVSDTKRAFYSHHTRPINSIYRRVVEELMVEMHLLSVNIDFRYDPIYVLGVVSSFDRFMQFYRPEADQASIFNAICQAVGGDPQKYRQDAQEMEALANQISWAEMLQKFGQPDGIEPASLREFLQGRLAQNVPFKYSRLFAVGLYYLLELSNPEAAKDESQRTAALKDAATILKLPEDKLLKDLELYRSNLEKIAQARVVMEDILQADRKQREQRAQEKTVASATTDSGSETPKDETAPTSDN